MYNISVKGRYSGHLKQRKTQLIQGMDVNKSYQNHKYL